jgi:hypothetical protein
MKHLIRYSLKIASQQKPLLFALVITSSLFISMLGIIPGLTSSAAAIPSDSQLLAQGRATSACANAAANDFSSDDTQAKIEFCAKNYVKGYKDPSGDSKKACSGTGASIGLCLAGYTKGQQDRKTADKAATQPAPSGNLSENQIRELGKTSAACTAYDNAGTDGDKALFGWCVNGYVAGYQGKPADWCEKNTPVTKTCKKGYDAGKSDKAGGINTTAAQTAATTQDADSDTEGAGPGLECNVSFNPLTWLLCPTVKGLVAIVGQVDNIIMSQLSVGSPGNGDDPNQIFCSSGSKATLKTKSGDEVKSCEAYKDAWKSVRNIALGLMVIAGLIVLIAQALGTELLDAYTIRKVLPRLLIAAVGITLSWELMQFFVRLSNDLGFGVRYLIYLPFRNIEDATLAGGGATALGLIEVTAILAMGIFGVLSFVATAALAVMIAFVVLVLREMLVIILVIFAPIAIVAYILPNTQKIYKAWWDFFSKALLMFPLIAAFIAIGRVFSVVASSSTSALGDMIAFVAYFAPYFLLPLTFQFAGGALRTIGGFVNDRGKGGFDRLRAYRGNKTKQNWERMQSNRRFNPNRKGNLGRINKHANMALSSLTSPGASAKIYGGAALNKMGIGNSFGQGILNSIDQQRFAHSMKLSEHLNAHGFNDRALRALMEMPEHSAGAIRAKAAELSMSENNNDRIAGKILGAQASWLSQELYQNEDMGRADIAAAAGLAITAQGFADTNDVAKVANRLNKTSPGLATMFATQAQLNGQRGGRVDMKPGYSMQMEEGQEYFGTAIETASGEVITDEGQQHRAIGHQIKRLTTTNQQEIQGAKAQAIKALSPGIQAMLSTKDFGDDGVARYEFVNERGETEYAEFTQRDVTRLAAMLGNAQSDFSSTATSTATAIDDVVNQVNLATSDPARKAYDRARRSDTFDPSQTGEQPQQPQDDKK